VRPRRPAAKLSKHPASTEAVHRDHDVAAHEATVLERLRRNDLPEQVWTVAFANGRRVSDDGEDDGYGEKAAEMQALAEAQPGFLGNDAVRAADGRGINVSRWSSVAAMVAWRKLPRHAAAQATGRAQWYQWYRSDVARVVRLSEFAYESTAEE
jgi:heme-degrading monooxygenase HmoA